MKSKEEKLKEEACKILDKIKKMPSEFEKLHLEFVNKVRKLI